MKLALRRSHSKKSRGGTATTMATTCVDSGCSECMLVSVSLATTRDTRMFRRKHERLLAVCLRHSFVPSRASAQRNQQVHTVEHQQMHDILRSRGKLFNTIERRGNVRQHRGHPDAQHHSPPARPVGFRNAACPLLFDKGTPRIQHMNLHLLLDMSLPPELRTVQTCALS